MPKCTTLCRFPQALRCKVRNICAENLSVRKIELMNSAVNWVVLDGRQYIETGLLKT